MTVTEKTISLRHTDLRSSINTMIFTDGFVVSLWIMNYTCLLNEEYGLGYFMT